MSIRTGFTSPLARICLFAALFVASIFIAIFAVIIIKDLEIIAGLDSEANVKQLKNTVIRVILLLFLVFSYIAILLNNSMRDWFFKLRWRLLLLTLFALGSALALSDLSHAIMHEYNWIRYVTSGALAAAGVLAIGNAMRSVNSLLDRLFGASFGLLLILAATDELFQLHEHSSDLFAAISPVQDNDFPTLVVAITGIVVLCILVFIRFYGGRLGELLQQQRYSLTLNLFAVAAICFMAAMLLDTIDYFLRDVVNSALTNIMDGFGAINTKWWLEVFDVRSLANSVEELLEYLSSLLLLLMIGNLYSIEMLGFPPDLQDTEPPQSSGPVRE